MKLPEGEKANLLLFTSSGLSIGVFVITLVKAHVPGSIASIANIATLIAVSGRWPGYSITWKVLFSAVGPGIRKVNVVDI